MYLKLQYEGTQSRDRTFKIVIPGFLCFQACLSYLYYLDAR